MMDVKFRIILEIAGVIITLVLFYNLVNEECKINAHCGPTEYCKYDNTCQQMPIELNENVETIHKEKNVLVPLSLFIGLLLIGGSIYYVKNG